MGGTQGGGRRAVEAAAIWAVLWAGFWAAAATAIGVMDPDSIDPGEPLGFFMIFGSMGVLTGLAFSALLRVRQSSPTFGRVIGLGMVATAAVQTLFLGHGDQGIAANIGVAAILSLIGGLVTMVWFVMARRLWPQWQSR